MGAFDPQLFVVIHRMNTQLAVHINMHVNADPWYEDQLKQLVKENGGVCCLRKGLVHCGHLKLMGHLMGKASSEACELGAWGCLVCEFLIATIGLQEMRSRSLRHQARKVKFARLLFNEADA